MTGGLTATSTVTAPGLVANSAGANITGGLTVATGGISAYGGTNLTTGNFTVPT